MAQGGVSALDVARAVDLLGAFFSGAGGNVSSPSGGGCFGGDSGTGEQGGFDCGGECLAVARGSAGRVLGRCGFMFSGGGIAGLGRRREGWKECVEGGGLGDCGSGEFFADRCFGGEGGADDRVSALWAVDDGRGSDVISTSSTGVGVGRVGEWEGAGLVGVGGGVDWGAGAGGAGGNCFIGGSDRGECGLCVAGVVVGGVGGLGGGMGGESGGGVTGEGVGDEGGGGGISFGGGVGGLGLRGGRS